MGVGEVVEAQVSGVVKLELDASDGVAPGSANAAEFTGFDRELGFARGVRTNRDGGFGRAIVRDIEAQEDARGGEAESGGLRFGVFQDEIEGAEFPSGDADLPLRFGLLGWGPVDYAGGICAVEDGARGPMRIVEGYIERRSSAALARY